MCSLNFFKYHSSGNDFILIEDEGQNLDIPLLCHRNFGIGADGVLLVKPSTSDTIELRIFNSDGSEASMCGNGLACATKHFNGAISIKTKAGLSKGRIENDKVLVSFPSCKILQGSIPLEKGQIGHLITTGTPHLVIFVEDIEAPNLLQDAPLYRYHPTFGPKGVNVNFVQAQKGSLKIRTYEKGVEKETLGCGTGGAAAVLATQTIGTTRVIFRSNRQALFSFDPNQDLWMETTAHLTFTGKWVE